MSYAGFQVHEIAKSMFHDDFQGYEKQKAKGYFVSNFDKTVYQLFVKWKDNDVVTMGSNYFHFLKWNVGALLQNKKIDLPQP